MARQHLGRLDRVARIVRLGVFVSTSGDVRDQPKVADGASDLLQDEPRGISTSFDIELRSHSAYELGAAAFGRKHPA
ncbi:MAG TPA: hypothetical protein VKT81_06965 [Bryobacteraceae bacterium]|nr:hypothetical protein [Bryobacteraceae bacterium]